MQYTRSCPECQEKIIYFHEWRFLKSVENGCLCRSCYLKQLRKRNQVGIFKKECPVCAQEIIYKNKNSLQTSIKKNLPCRKCGIVRGDSHHTRNGVHSFKGKKHSQETLNKLREINTGRVLQESSREKLRQFYRTHNNPMKGRSVYSVWLEKYGKKKRIKG